MILIRIISDVSTLQCLALVLQHLYLFHEFEGFIFVGLTMKRKGPPT